MRTRWTLVGLAVALTVCWPAFGAPGKVDVHVDPRFELMFILFRLAGHPEYNQAMVDGYTQDVDDHFGPYQGHRVVALARMLRRNHGISYDAPMSMACHLKEGFLFEERMPLTTPLPETLDERWAEAEPRRFLELAREFAADTSFREFFEQHHEIYSKSERQMTRLL